METRIVAIHGLIGHGKDTISLMMARNIVSKRKEKLSFAFKIKQNVSNITGIPLHSVISRGYSNTVWDFTREQKETHLDEWGMTLGKMLQIYGTEACRDNIHKDIWVKALMNSIPTNDDTTIYFITDLRFPNEAEALKNAGALLVKIVRPDLEKEKGRDHGHASEQGLPDELFDVIVTNDSDLADLEEEAKYIVSYFNLDPHVEVM
jgi:hypothetical protein